MSDLRADLRDKTVMAEELSTKLQGLEEELTRVQREAERSLKAEMASHAA